MRNTTQYTGKIIVEGHLSLSVFSKAGMTMTTGHCTTNAVLY